MKLPLRESEQDALLTALANWDGYVSSALLGTEAIRACRRYGAQYAADARSFLEGLVLLPLSDDLLDLASSIDPAQLRSLDALHLATALSIRDDVGAFVTYDERLASAAASHGLPVAQPA